MATVIPPVGRHMILCEGVRERPEEPGKVDLIGVISAIKPRGDTEYPILHPLLYIYLQVTNGRGLADLAIRIRVEETGRLVSGSPTYQRQFGNDPLAVRGISFRIADVRFPHPGLYTVEFVVGDQVIACEPILLR